MKGATLLVVDDETSVRNLLEASLSSQGYQICTAESYEQAWTVLQNRSDVTAILLDLGLPDRSGMELLLNLRSQGSKIPVLVVTATDDDEQKVFALDSGADDYVTKPFSIPELSARIRTAIRHFSGNPLGKVIRTGKLTVDMDAHRILVDGKEIKLTPLEFQILALLAKNLGKVVTHQTLLQKIWGPNAVNHVQYLRVHLGQVRKKMKEYGIDDLLTTESGVGYRLMSKP